MLPQSKKICTQRWAHEYIITEVPHSMLQRGALDGTAGPG